MTTRTKRSAGLVAVAAMAMLVLTACLNVTYNLTVTLAYASLRLRATFAAAALHSSAPLLARLFTKDSALQYKLSASL